MEKIFEAIQGRHTNKNILTKIEDLRSSEVLKEFCENNQDLIKKLSFLEINTIFTEIFTQLADDRVEETLALNLFDELTVIFTLLSLKYSEKTLKNQLKKSILYILINSVKFDVYKNTPSTVRKIISKNNYIMEFLWLIPFHANKDLLKQYVVDTKNCFQYAEEAVKVSKVYEDYVEKHYDFATKNYTTEVKETFQEYANYLNSLNK